MSDEGVPDARPKLSPFALFALVVVLAGIAALLVTTNNKNEAPFTAVEVHPKLVGLAVESRSGARYVVGRVDVDNRAAAGATYEVIVVDNRRHRVIPSSESSARWDGAAASLRDRYDWEPTALDRAAYFTAGSVTSFPFMARLPAAAEKLTDLEADLSVVLALTHDSDHVYWAVKLN